MDADNIVAKKNANESLEIDRNSRKLGKYLTKRKWKTERNGEMIADEVSIGLVGQVFKETRM